MKKIALLLAALLVLGMLAGCNAEEEKTPDHVVPGYSINFYTGDGWTEAEESAYDMQMSKDGVTMYAMGFTLMDFVDMPPAADLYLDCNDELFEEKTDVSVKEKETSYEKNGHQIISTLFSAKSGDETRQYYCFMVSFNDDAGSTAWVCFEATEKVMKQKKSELKKLVEEMDANGEYVSPEEMEELLEDGLDDGGEEYVDDYQDEVTPTDAAGDTATDLPEDMGSAVEENPDTTEPELEEEEAEEETKPAEPTGSTAPAEEEDAPDAATEAPDESTASAEGTGETTPPAEGEDATASTETASTEATE